MDFHGLVGRSVYLEVSDFMVQSTLAVSLAGQGLFAYGISQFQVSGDFEILLIAVMIMSTVLFVTHSFCHCYL